MNKKWVYFIQLSNHKEPDDGKGTLMFSKLFNPEANDNAWKPENDVDFGVWDRVVKRASECGYNTLLIDLGDAVQYKSPQIHGRAPFLRTASNIIPKSSSIRSGQRIMVSSLCCAQS